MNLAKIAALLAALSIAVLYLSVSLYITVAIIKLIPHM